jgi:hypothetical protein
MIRFNFDHATKERFMIRNTLLLIAVGAICSTSHAKTPVKKIEVAKPQPSLITVTPIYSQLLTFSYPSGFTPAFENSKDGSYIQESVLKGESVQRWSQMLTITGAQGLAMKKDVTPIRFAESMAGGYKNACPNSFATTGLGQVKLGAHDAFIALVSCGNLNPGAQAYSEAMLLIVIKGDKDYYTIQWAERGKASKTPIPFDNEKWSSRLSSMAPMKLCPVIPGEKAPYPSCTGAK